MESKNYSYRLAIAANQNIKERDYWLEKLSNNLQKTSIHYDFKKVEKAEPTMDLLEFALSGELSSRLMALSSGFDYTLHIVLVAGLVVLLYKYTGSKDILIGSTIYKQEVESEFINTVLVLRNQLKEPMTFKELLLQVKQTVLEATENQNYPFQVLLEQLHLPTSQRENPLFEIALLLENIHHKSYFQDLDYRVLFSFLRTQEGIEGRVEYDSRLYRKATIERIIQHFTSMMDRLVCHVDIQLSVIDILSEKEKDQILQDFNRKEWQYPREDTILEIFEEQVKKTPDRNVCFEKGGFITFKELDERANLLAEIIGETEV